jgi:hypothetical protein
MKGIESVMRGYADGGSVNPFQDYAGGPQSFNPFAALSYLSAQGRPDFAIRPPATIATPVAQTGGGYRDIYGNLEAIKEAQALKRALEAAAKVVPEAPAGQGTSAGDSAGASDPATAGGTATTTSGKDFAMAVLGATNPMAMAASILGQMAINPARQPTPGLFGLLSAARDAYSTGQRQGVELEAERGLQQDTQRAATQVGTQDQEEQQQELRDYLTEIERMDNERAVAAREQGAPTVGIPGVDINVEPGQGQPGSPGADPTTDSGVGQSPESTYARGGYVPGKSGGMDDDVPAIIDGKEPARLSSGEFVFDAATVAALGDGNNQAGAQKLDGLRKAIRKKAYGHEKQPPQNYSVGDLVRMYDRRR